MIFNFSTQITFWFRRWKIIWWQERMYAMWKFELRKYDISEKREHLLNKMSKYQNIKIANNSKIKWRDELACYLLVQIMDLSTFPLYYQFEVFCKWSFKFLIGNFAVELLRNFFLIENPNFQNNLVHTCICQKTDKIDAKMKALQE